MVIVEDGQERHTEGSYYLTLYDGTMQVRLSVGKNVQDADTQWQRKKAELNAVNNAKEADLPVPTNQYSSSRLRTLLSDHTTPLRFPLAQPGRILNSNWEWSSAARRDT